MRLLVTHNNFPGQFRRLVPSWVTQGHDVIFLSKSKEWHAPNPDGYRLIRYEPHRSGGGAHLHPYLRRLEPAIIEGQAAYRAAQQLKNEGWEPDVIINHVGFGNGLFLSDLFPTAKKVGLFEWFYNPFGSDVDFLSNGQVSADHQQRLRIWNTETLQELVSCDHAVVPTIWQRDQFPSCLRSKISVAHEGIDFDGLQSLRAGGIPLPECLPQDPGIEVLTYVSRCFEAYRGFPQAIQAICRLQQQRPNLHVLLAGHDGTAYGVPRSDGLGWAEWAKKSLPLDPKRTHWLGSLQDYEYRQVLACSDVHLYLTVPFILSWSLLEAMAAGCAVVASNTPPVQEVLQHRRSALLVDFFDVEAQVSAMGNLFEQASLRKSLGAGAQRQAQHYSHSNGSRAWSEVLERVVATL